MARTNGVRVCQTQALGPKGILAGRPSWRACHPSQLPNPGPPRLAERPGLLLLALGLNIKQGLDAKLSSLQPFWEFLGHIFGWIVCVCLINSWFHTWTNQLVGNKSCRSAGWCNHRWQSANQITISRRQTNNFIPFHGVLASKEVPDNATSYTIQISFLLVLSREWMGMGESSIVIIII